MDHYILRDGVPVREPDLMTWAMWFQNSMPERVLARTELVSDAKVMVSTVFLGSDHSFYGGPPVLWETMVFADGFPFDNDTDRYCTRDEALRGHQQMVDAVSAQLSEGVILTG